MNEYELIGRLADLDTRLKKLEGIEPIQPPQQPQPAPVTLVGVCEDYFDWIDTGCAYVTDYKLQGHYNDKIRQALTAERKRAVLVRDVVVLMERALLCAINDQWLKEATVALRALDAFDKERGA